MAQLNMKLQGWHAVLGLIFLVGLTGVRLVTFRDKTDDQRLMRDLQRKIAADYLPHEAARLQAAMNASDQQDISRVARSITNTKPRIESVRISSPFLDFSYPKDVVVKVVYSLAEGAKTSRRRTLYFLYSYSAVGDVWIYQHQTTAVRYYLNFA